MIDLRYHIATVAALFLALGLGIFIGSTMISDGILVREQEQLIVSLEQEFDRLRDDNRFLKANVASLQESLNAYDELGREIFPLLVQSKLENRNIGLIITDPDFNPDGFIEVLTELGVQFSDCKVLEVPAVENVDSFIGKIRLIQFLEY